MGWTDIVKRVGEGVATGGVSEAYRAAGGGSLLDAAKSGTIGDEHTYDQAQVDPSVGYYGDSAGYYKQRLGQLDDQRLGATADQAQARAYQQQAAQSYLDTVQGKGPSLAQLQMQQGQQTAALNAANLAATARGGGGNQLLAMQSAQRQNAMQSQDANMQSAMLRAQEVNAARQGLAQAGTAMRGQDVGRESGYLGAQQQMTDSYDQQKLGLAQVQSGNYNAAQGLTAHATDARDQRKTELVKGAMNAAGSAASRY